MGNPAFLTWLYRIFQLFQDPDIISEKFSHLVAAGDPGKNAFRVGVTENIQPEVGGDDRGFSPCQSFVDAEKELGGDEGIGQLRTQIVDDQKVTVKNVGMHVFRLFFRFRTLEGRPSQKIKKLEGGKINDGMSCL